MFFFFIRYSDVKYCCIVPGFQFEKRSAEIIDVGLWYGPYIFLNLIQLLLLLLCKLEILITLAIRYEHILFV